MVEIATRWVPVTGLAHALNIWRAFVGHQREVSADQVIRDCPSPLGKVSSTSPLCLWYRASTCNQSIFVCQCNTTAMAQRSGPFHIIMDIVCLAWLMLIRGTRGVEYEGLCLVAGPKQGVCGPDSRYSYGTLAIPFSSIVFLFNWYRDITQGKFWNCKCPQVSLEYIWLNWTSNHIMCIKDAAELNEALIGPLRPAK